jgi:hypothetical protein
MHGIMTSNLQGISNNFSRVPAALLNDPQAELLKVLIVGKPLST